MSKLIKIFKKSPDIVSRQIDKETILVPIVNNTGDMDSIYTLNPMASRIWELIDGKYTIGQIKDILLREFDAATDKIEKDLSSFLSQLQQIKAIEEKKKEK